MNQKTILLALFSSIFLCFSSFSLADEPQINAENYSSPHHLTETPKECA